jgi:two-component system sensor histidine kinase DesK
VGVDVGIYRAAAVAAHGEGMPALAYPLVSRRRTPARHQSVRVPILLTRPQVAWGVVGLAQREWSGGAARWATPAALAYGSVFPLLQLALVAHYPASDGDVRWALLATAVYLPLHLHHVYWSVRGVRPPGALWTLAALAAVVTATVPVGGTHWLPVFAIVAVSAMLVLPWPWSLVVAAGVTLGQAPLALAIDSPIVSASSYYVFAVWWRASALFVPLWLLGSVRQLEAARRALAEDAVVRERLRIDREVRRTVGAALGSIAAGGERVAGRLAGAGAAGPLGGDGDALARDVRALAEDSRQALAETRRLVSGYRQPSLAAELETAVTLLAAAGVDARVELPREALPADAGPGVRSALRDATAAVLRDETAASCVIAVRYDGGRLRLDVRTDAAPVAGPAGAAP